MIRLGNHIAEETKDSRGVYFHMRCLANHMLRLVGNKCIVVLLGIQLLNSALVRLQDTNLILQCGLRLRRHWIHKLNAAQVDRFTTLEAAHDEITP